MLLNASTFDVSIQDPHNGTVVSLKKCIFLVILLSKWSNDAPPSLAKNFSLIPKSADEDVPVHSDRRCLCQSQNILNMKYITLHEVLCHLGTKNGHIFSYSYFLFFICLCNSSGSRVMSTHFQVIFLSVRVTARVRTRVSSVNATWCELIHKKHNFTLQNYSR